MALPPRATAGSLARAVEEETAISWQYGALAIEACSRPSSRSSGDGDGDGHPARVNLMDGGVSAGEG